MPALNKHHLLDAVASKAATVEQVKVAPVSVMYARLPHPTPCSREAATNPLSPVPLHLISKGGYTTKPNQKEGDLVHESSWKEPGLAHLQIYLRLHELALKRSPITASTKCLVGKP